MPLELSSLLLGGVHGGVHGGVYGGVYRGVYGGVYGGVFEVTWRIRPVRKSILAHSRETPMETMMTRGGCGRAVSRGLCADRGGEAVSVMHGDSPSQGDSRRRGTLSAVRTSSNWRTRGTSNRQPRGQCSAAALACHHLQGHRELRVHGREAASAAMPSSHLRLCPSHPRSLAPPSCLAPRREGALALL